MTESSNLIIAVLVFLGGGSVTAVIGYLFLRPKTRAEAASKRAEGDNLDVRSQDAIIASQAAYTKRLEERIERLEMRLDDADRREHIVAIFVYESSNWMRRASDLMEPNQRELVGPPPKADPELFVGFSTGKRSRPQ
jgi:UPF0716 family protein affecting phage T7 exclusion